MGEKSEMQLRREANEFGIAQELRALRKGKGISTVKFSECPTILSFFNPDDVAYSLREFLAFVIPRDKRWKDGALCNAFGVFLKDPGTLTKRREDFARDKKKSVDTVRDWEDLMIYDLSRLQFTELYDQEKERPDEIVVYSMGPYDKEELPLTKRLWPFSKGTQDE
jgi:hypothetical protein